MSGPITPDDCPRLEPLSGITKSPSKRGIAGARPLHRTAGDVVFRHESSFPVEEAQSSMHTGTTLPAASVRRLTTFLFGAFALAMLFSSCREGSESIAPLAPAPQAPEGPAIDARIAFVSTRDGSPRIYVATADGSPRDGGTPWRSVVRRCPGHRRNHGGHGPTFGRRESHPECRHDRGCDIEH